MVKESNVNNADCKIATFILKRRKYFLMREKIIIILLQFKGLKLYEYYLI